jgi:hypothetical protein
MEVKNKVEMVTIMILRRNLQVYHLLVLNTVMTAIKKESLKRKGAMILTLTLL